SRAGRPRVNGGGVGARPPPLSNASVPPPHANTFTQLARPPERREDAKRYQPSVIGRVAPYLLGGVSSSRRQSVLGQVFDDIAQALVGVTQVIDHPLGVSNHGSRDRRVARRDLGPRLRDSRRRRAQIVG